MNYIRQLLRLDQSCLLQQTGTDLSPDDNVLLILCETSHFTTSTTSICRFRLSLPLHLPLACPLHFLTKESKAYDFPVHLVDLDCLGCMSAAIKSETLVLPAPMQPVWNARIERISAPKRHTASPVTAKYRVISNQTGFSESCDPGRRPLPLNHSSDHLPLLTSAVIVRGHRRHGSRRLASRAAGDEAQGRNRNRSGDRCGRRCCGSRLLLPKVLRRKAKGKRPTRSFGNQQKLGN
ncbi:hypothetical protein F4780DRAFT_599439 [Xylariomycetidae sp. FL0641]|nr:hypothetical protein F4780DRAFT_599439 [Xylariomycetidae sp. FL0641]